MTVDRYLRLIAGFFVMLSVALGYWVQPVLVSVHGLRRAEPVPIGVHQLVPDDDHPAEGRRPRQLSATLEEGYHARTADLSHFRRGLPSADAVGSAPVGRTDLNGKLLRCRVSTREDRKRGSHVGEAGLSRRPRL